MTLQIEERNAVLTASLVLLTGVVIGWKLKELRLKYLKAKRDFFLRKANATQDLIAGDDAVTFVCVADKQALAEQPLLIDAHLLTGPVEESS